MSGPYSTLTATDYLEAAQALLPRGPAWPRDSSATLTKFLNAVANVGWLAHNALADLFETELDPTQTNQMLPDWEAAFGIVPGGTKDDRRINLKAVISNPGGSSKAHYIALAASLGVTIAGSDITVGSPGTYTWTMHLPSSLSASKRAAVQALIAQHNRASCTLHFT